MSEEGESRRQWSQFHKDLIILCGLGESIAASGAASRVPACFLLHEETVLSTRDCTTTILLLVSQRISAKVILNHGLGIPMVQELFSTEWPLTVLSFIQSLNDVHNETLLPFSPQVLLSLVLCWPQSIGCLVGFFQKLINKPHDVLCSKELFYVIVFV